MVHGLYAVPTSGYHISATPMDGNLDEVEAIDRTPDGGMLITRIESGRAVKTEFMPTKMRWDSEKVKIPDFQTTQFTSLSERAKALIERFEPGVHQFLPVDFYYEKSDVKERRYFFICCNRIDSVDHAKTTFVLKHIVTTTNIKLSYWVPIQDLVRNGEQNLIPPHLSPETSSKYVFSLAKIGKLHLWHDKYLSGGIWMSNSLAEAIAAASFTGIKLPNKAEAV
jgi:hypothetical protein